MIKAKPTPGSQVILRELPKGFLDDLPKEDQVTLRSAVGKRWLLESFDDDGRAVLTFWVSKQKSHTILVDLGCIEA